MHRTLRALALGFALACVPACASVFPPVTEQHASQTLEQRAYVLLNGYAAVLEEAADLVRDLDTPPAVIRALAQAEAAATPSVEALHQALTAYAAADAATRASRTDALSQAIEAAEAPVAAMRGLVGATE
ncbi:MAG: hypothetical protein H7124_17345 [Phycisphaerales bacterium]|nr:hypothetical protein [Hyphomonadaceae bacterium]